MGTAKILIASNNPDKIKEMKAILSDNFEPVSLKDEKIFSDPEETGKTLSLIHIWVGTKTPYCFTLSVISCMAASIRTLKG